MTISLKKEGLMVSGILFLSVWIAILGLRHALDAENHLAAKRLAHAFIPLLAKAHAAKDDLALQEDVMALAQAPGVPMACIVDLDEKVIAHNHLAQLGKPYDGPRGGDEVHQFPLKDGAIRWGTLLFYLSENSLHHSWLQGALMLGTGALSMGIGYSVRLRIEAHRLQKLRLALADQTTLGREKDALNQHLTQAMGQAQRQAGIGFQTIVEKFSEPLLLLDAHQRVAAFNAEAGKLLGLGQKERWINASWQDVPWLQDQGLALERSLQTPNEEVLVEDARYEGTFRTEQPWTWIRPRPALRVCR